MEGLIERLEQAEGPSRSLDAEIMFDLYAKPVGTHEVDGGPRGYLWPEDNPSWNFGLRFPGKDRGWFSECRRKIDSETLVIERDNALVLMNSLRVPPLTASLDAAQKLVPNGWVGNLEIGSIGQLEKPRADFWNGEFAPYGREIHVQAATPALALVIAALRAREEG